MPNIAGATVDRDTGTEQVHNECHVNMHYYNYYY